MKQDVSNKMFTKHYDRVQCARATKIPERREKKRTIDHESLCLIKLTLSFIEKRGEI